jgi:hypothetical protein
LSDQICIKANKIKKRSTGTQLGHVIYALLASARFTEQRRNLRTSFPREAAHIALDHRHCLPSSELLLCHVSSVFCQHFFSMVQLVCGLQ